MLGCKPLGESIRVRLSKKTAAHYCTNVQLSKKTYVRVQKKSFRLRLSAPAHWITSIEEISLQRGTAKTFGTLASLLVSPKYRGREDLRYTPDVRVLPLGSPEGIPRRVVMSRDSPISECDGARNTSI